MGVLSVLKLIFPPVIWGHSPRAVYRPLKDRRADPYMLDEDPELGKRAADLSPTCTHLGVCLQRPV